ncbi:hypothetical protein DSM112329_00130 [Paraconexibacter sp. AEG42_29]|uniref:Uncharacterized protein n=1 Tax=Paraconexibacter sp. AEG42_29 TaxID=2997339 RepID=A0AAU7ANU1_9ACTN
MTPALGGSGATPPSVELAAEEVALYQRTYSTLLRSTGETDLRVLEAAHRAMASSLHPHAAEEDVLDLGAFMYATARLPAEVFRATRIVMGQEASQFTKAGIGPLDDWEPVEAVARRRRWFAAPPPAADDDPAGPLTYAVLLSSTSDLDDLVPTLVAFQIEWNKLRRKLRGVGWPRPQKTPGADDCTRALGGSQDDWARLQEVWGTAFAARLGDVATREMRLRIRMLGGSAVGYARMTRHWFRPIRTAIDATGLQDGPVYFVSSNTHSLANLVSGEARAMEDELVDWVRREGPRDLREEVRAFDTGATRGSWENFLYYAARDYHVAHPRQAARRRDAERGAGVVHLGSTTALSVAAQVTAVRDLDPARLDPRIGGVDTAALAASRGVIVNVDYPLGLAAYNILREICEDADTLSSVYVLGKAATLNADVGDVLISSVVHDEHSNTTYWLDNAFGVEDIAPYLRFGSGLDNQRAVTVKSTFLQNRTYLDFYYREAYTVVEMEAGPYCAAVYEVADSARYPIGQHVNFSKLPIDFGIIHYASDTPYTQARTLGARGLNYRGMDSTYASSIAILRRILSREGALSTRTTAETR